MTLPRTVADVLSDHVVLEVECIDRLYLNVYQPRLQYPAGVAAFFLGHRGARFASSVLMDPISKAFVASVHSFARDQGVPVVGFVKGQRKDDLARAYLGEFEAAGRSEGVLFVGVAQEKTRVFRTEKRRNPLTGASYPWIVPSTGVVNHFYFYCVDSDFGPFFLKFCSYFPYNARLCLNGHEYAKRQAARAGIGFTALDNGFAAVDEATDAVRLQRICDRLTPSKIDALLRKWLRILPHPYTRTDRAAGYRYDISVLQAEFSLTQMLDRPVTGRVLFEEIIRENLDVGRPDQVGLVFDRRIRTRGPRPTPGRFRTRVLTTGVTPSLHVDYKHSKIKQYHIISSGSFRVPAPQGVWRRRHVLDAPLTGEVGGHSLALTRRSRRSPSSRATCSCSRALQRTQVSQVDLHRLDRQQVVAQHRPGDFTAGCEDSAPSQGLPGPVGRWLVA